LYLLDPHSICSSLVACVPYNCACCLVCCCKHLTDSFTGSLHVHRHLCCIRTWSGTGNVHRSKRSIIAFWQLTVAEMVKLATLTGCCNFVLAACTTCATQSTTHGITTHFCLCLTCRDAVLARRVWCMTSSSSMVPQFRSPTRTTGSTLTRALTAPSQVTPQCTILFCVVHVQACT